MSSGPVAMRRPVEFPVRSEAPTSAAATEPAWACGPLRSHRAAAGGTRPRGLIFAWSRIDPIIEKIHISETEQAPEEIDTVTMENGALAGVDAQTGSFRRDGRARRSVGDDTITSICSSRRPTSCWPAAPGRSPIGYGRLQRDTQILDLVGKVLLTQDQGYEFHTTKARIDLARGRQRATHP